jgi:hypothetical protein
MRIHGATASATTMAIAISSKTTGEKNQNASMLRRCLDGVMQMASNDTVLDFLLSLDHFAMSGQGYEVSGFFSL